MDTKQIAKLRELLGKATGGEWWVQRLLRPGAVDLEIATESFDVVSATVGLRREEDARLIAAMHNALPGLLDAAEEVERLRRRQNDLSSLLGELWPEGLDQPHDDHDAVELLCVEVTESRALVERLRAYRLAVAEAVGVVYEADWMPPEPGPDDLVIAEIRDLQREPETLRARLAEWEGLRGDVRECVVSCSANGRKDSSVRRLLAHLNREDEPKRDPQAVAPPPAPDPGSLTIRVCSRCGDELQPWQTRCDDEGATGASVHFICGGEPKLVSKESQKAVPRG